MNPGKFFSTLVAISLLVAAGCSSQKGKDNKENKQSAVSKAMYESNTPDQPTNVQTQGTDQVDFAVIEFDRGEAKLSEMDRRHINELAMKMTGAGKVVDDVKILTWSDRAVKTNQEASNTEIILARQRAESIKAYLDRNLPAQEDIDFYNMAENPERYSSYMERKGIPLDQAFSDNGKPAPADGRALVIIEYQSGPMPSTL